MAPGRSDYAASARWYNPPWITYRAQALFSVALSGKNVIQIRIPKGHTDYYMTLWHAFYQRDVPDYPG